MTRGVEGGEARRARPGFWKPALEYPPTFWALVQEAAEKRSDRVILSDDSARTLTSRQFHDAALDMAARLMAHGVGPGDAVSWQLPTRIDSMVLMAALARIGARQNPIIPILRHREVRFITSQTKAQLLIVPRVWRNFDYKAMADDLAGEIGFTVLTIDQLLASDARGELPAEPAHLPKDELPDRWIYYSSGTTSDPKGGRHTDQSVMAGASGMIGNMGMLPDDVFPIPFPVAHIGGICGLTASLSVGYNNLLIETWDPERSPFFMAERGASILGSAVPFFLAFLAAQRKHGPDKLFTRLRCVGSGGAPKPPEMHFEIQRELDCRGIISSWGLTEFPIATYCTFDDTEEMLAHTEGRPSPGVDIRVVGSDGLDLPPGQEGELRLKGPQMIRGYVDAALDRDGFDEQGYFRTGDLGVMEPTGHIRITGRLKDVIIRNAENISAQEVENVLYTHDRIKDVAVIGLPDNKTGERCVAVVQLEEGARPLTLHEIAAHCVAHELAKQKIPEQLEIVDLLPRNAMGKILKQDLRKRFGGK